jgi:hypothetical protein
LPLAPTLELRARSASRRPERLRVRLTGLRKTATVTQRHNPKLDYMRPSHRGLNTCNVAMPLLGFARDSVPSCAGAPFLPRFNSNGEVVCSCSPSAQMIACCARANPRRHQVYAPVQVSCFAVVFGKDLKRCEPLLTRPVPVTMHASLRGSLSPRTLGSHSPKASFRYLWPVWRWLHCLKLCFPAGLLHQIDVIAKVRSTAAWHYRRPFPTESRSEEAQGESSCSSEGENSRAK